MRLTLIVLTVITLGGTEDITRCDVEYAHDDTPIRDYCTGNFESYKHIVFKDCQFSQFPDLFYHFATIEDVDISKSGVEHIDHNIFLFAHKPFTKLAMGGNCLSQLEDFTFVYLNSLNEMDVSRNKIETIEPKAFTGLTNLTRLDLSYNNITHLNAEIFVPLIELVSLRFTNNKIQSIQADIFEHNVNLKFAYFSSNDMVSIDDTSFFTTQLSILDLEFNSLSKVNMSMLKHLRKLIIADNKLNLLIVPPNVEELHAERNKITAIQSVQNSKLKHLFLASNRFVDGTNFTDFPELLSLDLSFNNFQNFEFASIKALTHLKTLSFKGMKLAKINITDLTTNLPSLVIITVSTTQWYKKFERQLEAKLLDLGIILIADSSTISDGEITFEYTTESIKKTSKMKGVSLPVPLYYFIPLYVVLTIFILLFVYCLLKFFNYSDRSVVASVDDTENIGLRDLRRDRRITTIRDRPTSTTDDTSAEEAV